MKILIADDCDRKLEDIKKYLLSLDVSESEIVVAKTLAEFSSKMKPDVGVCVIDMRIPAYDGAQPDRNGLGILQNLEASGNRDVKLLAISAYAEEFEGVRAQFERHGCVLADYKDREVWQNALKTLVLQSSAKQRFDFLIFTALRKERAPYVSFTELGGQSVQTDGLTRYDITLDGRCGAVIELPRMGLVDAAIIAAKCIDRYSPKIVAMSGICAGFREKAELGQLLISELAYEYQTGKWTDDGFKADPYQTPISEKLRLLVRHLLENEELVPELEKGWRKTRPTATHEPKLSVFTSGSAVIASKDYIEQVASHHRKVSGLDMEVFAIHRAAQLASNPPEVLCAKVVVDLADSDKNDNFQEYGCYTSSKFILHVLKEYFRLD